MGLCRTSVQPKSDGQRTPSKSLDDFASWAFGAQGIQSLRGIAFGDFSYNGRYADGNILLGRARESIAMGAQEGQKYRVLGEDDMEHKEILKEYLGVLEACPTDSLFGFYDCH